MFASPGGYEKFMGRWSQSIAPLVLEFAKIPDGWRVLDVGAGTGSLSIAIAGAGPIAKSSGSILLRNMLPMLKLKYAIKTCSSGWVTLTGFLFVTQNLMPAYRYLYSTFFLIR